MPLTPLGSSENSDNADVAQAIATADAAQQAADAATQAAANVRQMILSRDPRLVTLEQLAAGVQELSAESQQDRSGLHDDVTDLQAAIADLHQQIATVQTTPGPAGKDGAAGTDGKSAYQLARDSGYGGTQTQWLASLKGADGVGTPGKDGAAGTDGKSAYQLARDAGYGGTQAQWLASLTGPKGDKGDTGPTGPTGTANLTLGARAVAALVLGGSVTVLVPLSKAMPTATYSVAVTHTGAAATSDYTWQVVPTQTTTTTVAVKITAGAALLAGTLIVAAW